MLIKNDNRERFIGKQLYSVDVKLRLWFTLRAASHSM